MSNLSNEQKDYSPSSEHTREQIREVNYDLTWRRLPIEVFRSVGLYLDLKRDIVPLLCVCKEMTIKVLRELCYVTGYYPNPNFLAVSYPPIEVELTCKVFTSSSSFDLHPLSISYTSPWWHMVKDPCLIIRCLIINIFKTITKSMELFKFE
jgi:hypothetical protein